MHPSVPMSPPYHLLRPGNAGPMSSHESVAGLIFKTRSANWGMQ